MLSNNMSLLWVGWDGTKMLSMPNGIQSKTMWNHTNNLTNIGCFQWHSTGPKDNMIVNPDEREQKIRQLSGKEAIQKQEMFCYF